jgi:DNA-directed RNA polymerase specialized sigma subunit
MAQQVDDPEHFTQFKETLKQAIAKYGHMPEADMQEVRKGLVEGLSAYELEFQKTIRNTELGKLFYERFLHHIIDVKKNILSARPFFRERQTLFIEKISDLIKARDWVNLTYYHVNYQFIFLVTKNHKWQTKEDFKIKAIVDKIVKTRQELITINMPLVVNRATIFWSRTHKSHLSFMDLVQIGVEGLTSAIDKYCGKYQKVWPGVCIGRIVGNYIDELSQTLIHFYPTDKRKIYRANKFRARHPHGDYEDEDMVAVINSQTQLNATPEEIADLLAAVSVVSCDTRPPIDDNLNDNLSHYEAPESCRPDVRAIEKESMNLMKDYINLLSLIDRKILKLKGLTLTV